MSNSTDKTGTSSIVGNPPTSHKSYAKDCALFAKDSSGPIVASGKALGPGLSKIEARLVSVKTTHTNPWTGFQLVFPLGEKQVDNEDAGFGVRHHYDRTVSGGLVLQCDVHKISVKFPRDQNHISVTKASPEVLARFPNAKAIEKGLSIVSVRLDDGARVTVDGFGIPFANQEDKELERWVNENKAILETDKVTLLDVLQQTEFFFLVANPRRETEIEWHPARLPPAFDYPYGTQHNWDQKLYERILQENKSKVQFQPAYSYEDDNAHLAVLTQTNVQDVLWLDDAAREIRQTKFPAYFIALDQSCAPADAQRFYVIMPLRKEFREPHDAAWRRLTKNAAFEVMLFGSHDDKKEEAAWECMIMDHPQGIDRLKDHPTDKYDLVLLARRPNAKQEGHDFEVKTFKDPDCKRKIEAVCHFHPTAEPTNPEAFGLGDSSQPEDITARLRSEVEDRMDLHRALMRGNGFYDWMTRPGATVDLSDQMAATTLDDKVAPKWRPLPVVNFLDVDEEYADALLKEALPEDRIRFRRYLSKRALGLGIITAGPGFGKTTALAIATLAMQASLGNILCSGPSNVSVDNFASRIDRITSSVSKRFNEDKPDDDLARTRHRLVVRAYKPKDETEAFLHLLEHPSDGNNAAPRRGWTGASKWQLDLSVAFWLLVVLRSPAVRELHPDDSEALHKLRDDVDKRDDLVHLRSVATGETTWEQYKDSKQMFHADKITALIEAIVGAADILCTTPAMTANYGLYKVWKNHAKGITVDEAANMNRADLACVWGNTLLPCFLGGDPKQFPPTVTTTDDKDALENYIHRLPQDGQISPIQFFQVSGIPIYRLRVQLRMADGLFDAIAAEIYPQVPFTYGPSCNVNLPQFATGRALEAFLNEKYALPASPAGKLSPVFIHCEGSQVFVDEMTGSKKSVDQVKIALDLAVEFVKSKNIDPSEIVMLAPYAANVRLITRMRKRQPEYTDKLSAMPSASTVDSYQGKESNIVIIVMGTAYRKPGPGFTSDEHRLNVMLTRQRCGLVIVGDINVTGPFDDDGKLGTRKGKGKGTKGSKAKTKGDLVERFIVEGANGQVYLTKATVLRNMHTRFWMSGRVVRISAKAEEFKSPAT